MKRTVEFEVEHPGDHYGTPQKFYGKLTAALKAEGVRRVEDAPLVVESENTSGVSTFYKVQSEVEPIEQPDPKPEAKDARRD